MARTAWPTVEYALNHRDRDEGELHWYRWMPMLIGNHFRCCHLETQRQRWDLLVEMSPSFLPILANYCVVKSRMKLFCTTYTMIMTHVFHSASLYAPTHDLFVFYYDNCRIKKGILPSSCVTKEKERVLFGCGCQCQCQATMKRNFRRVKNSLLLNQNQVVRVLI